MRNLTRENKQTFFDDNEWIITRRQKTKTSSNVLLMDIPLKIIEKYEGLTEDDKLLPVPSYVYEYFRKTSAIFLPFRLYTKEVLGSVLSHILNSAAAHFDACVYALKSKHCLLAMTQFWRNSAYCAGCKLIFPYLVRFAFIRIFVSGIELKIDEVKIGRAKNRR